jgi:SM-20-related protein
MIRSVHASVIAEELSSAGIAICNQFIAAPLVETLRAELISLANAGSLTSAAVGVQRTTVPLMRGDLTQWITPETASKDLTQCLNQLEQVRCSINATSFLGLFELELHYALYPPGKGYVRHLDQFRGKHERRVSCVLYLNEAWCEEDGGALRIFVGDGVDYEDIMPCGGTLVTFLSDRFEHEVLPARRPRCSLTGWYRTRVLTVLE